MSIDTRNLESMLAELRATSALAHGKPAGQVQEAGGADFAQVLKSTLEQVKNTTAARLQRSTATLLYLNTSTALFWDERVRQALSLGIDREAIVRRVSP